MGVSRRSFLTLFSLAASGLVLDPLIPVVANNNIYVNKKLGVAFRSPEEWNFYDVKKMEKMYDDQIFKPDSPFINEFIEELKGQPLVSLGMYPLEEADEEQFFSPSIVLRLEPREEGGELENILTESDNYLSNIVKSYESKGNGPIIDVCGYRAIQGNYSYIFEAERMKPTPIAGRSCIIEVGEHYYSFNMYNYDPVDSDIERLFDRFVSSIMIL